MTLDGAQAGIRAPQPVCVGAQVARRALEGLCALGMVLCHTPERDEGLRQAVRVELGEDAPGGLGRAGGGHERTADVERVQDEPRVRQHVQTASHPPGAVA